MVIDGYCHGYTQQSELQPQAEGVWPMTDVKPVSAGTITDEELREVLRGGVSMVVMMKHDETEEQFCRGMEYLRMISLWYLRILRHILGNSFYVSVFSSSELGPIGSSRKLSWWWLLRTNTPIADLGYMPLTKAMLDIYNDVIGSPVPRAPGLSSLCGRLCLSVPAVHSGFGLWRHPVHETHWNRELNGANPDP